MKQCKTIRELQSEFHTIKSIVSGDTRFGAQALMFMAERIDALGSPKKRAKRPLTPWQRAMRDGLKAGKSIQQISEEYRARKAGLSVVPA